MFFSWPSPSVLSLTKEVVAVNLTAEEVAVWVDILLLQLWYALL